MFSSFGSVCKSIECLGLSILCVRLDFFTLSSSFGVGAGTGILFFSGAACLVQSVVLDDGSSLLSQCGCV